MTTSRLFKLLVLLAVLASAATILQWYETGERPDTMFSHLAVVLAVAALIVGLIGTETRPRLMLRFLAALFTLLGVIAFAADYSLIRGNASGKAFTLLDHLNSFAPSLVMALENALRHTLGDWAWDPLLTAILNRPAYLIFFLLAISAGIAGRPRRPVRIFVN